MQIESTNLRGFRDTFKHNRVAIAGLVMLSLAIGMAVFAPYFAPYEPNVLIQVTVDDIYAPPSPEHWFGTDDVGEDVLSNFIYGSRTSLTVGFFASFISMCIGGVIGIMAGFLSGRVDNSMMRITDILLVIPTLPLMLVLVALTTPSLTNIILVIGILSWTGTARLVRSQTLSVKERKFVLRAKAIGAGNFYIIRRHLLPLVLPVLVANTMLIISGAILSESALSFLGLSDPTTLSWGKMLNAAFTRGAISAGAWWALLPPGFGIVWVVFGCTLLGHGMEQILNPPLKTSHYLAVGKKMVARLKEEKS